MFLQKKHWVQIPSLSGQPVGDNEEFYQKKLLFHLLGLVIETAGHRRIEFAVNQVVKNTTELKGLFRGSVCLYPRFISSYTSLCSFFNWFQIQPIFFPSFSRILNSEAPYGISFIL